MMAESIFKDGKSWKEASRTSLLCLRAVLLSLQPGKNKKSYNGFVCSRYHTVFSRKQRSAEYLAEARCRVRHFCKKVLLVSPDNILVRQLSHMKELVRIHVNGRWSSWDLNLWLLIPKSAFSRLWDRYNRQQRKAGEGTKRTWGNSVPDSTKNQVFCVYILSPYFTEFT